MTSLVKRGGAYVISLMAKIMWISVHFLNRGRGVDGALHAGKVTLGGMGPGGGREGGGGGVGAGSGMSGRVVVGNRSGHDLHIHSSHCLGRGAEKEEYLDKKRVRVKSGRRGQPV
jgi:hypothetical protein